MERGRGQRPDPVRMPRAQAQSLGHRIASCETSLSADAAHMRPLRLRFIAVNKQERTYTILRDRIHSGSFAPLERLNIDALASELGVSPIPVREALRRLEAEGWVRFTPNVGAVVSPVDSTSWEQAMIALAILEGAASGEAQQNLRRSDLTRLRKIAAGMEEAAARAGPLRVSKPKRLLPSAPGGRCPHTPPREAR